MGQAGVVGMVGAGVCGQQLLGLVLLGHCHSPIVAVGKHGEVID